VRAGWDRDGHEPSLRQLEPAAELLADLALVASGKRVLDAAAGERVGWRVADVQALPYRALPGGRRGDAPIEKE
jgi:hypothetical protein